MFNLDPRECLYAIVAGMLFFALFLAVCWLLPLLAWVG